MVALSGKMLLNSSEILGIVPPEPPLEALQGAKEKISRLAAIIESANVVRSWFWPHLGRC
jgi:hypothetical protein